MAASAAWPACATSFRTWSAAPRVDPPPIAHQAVSACALAQARAGPLPLFAGGRSFGGRMTSQAQALGPLIGVRGLVFFAFPLHPAGKPSVERAAHLSAVAIPMLFLQGTKDALADLPLLERTVAGLGGRASLNSPSRPTTFHVPARTGRKDADARDQILTRRLPGWRRTDALYCEGAMPHLATSTHRALAFSRGDDRLGSRMAGRNRCSFPEPGRRDPSWRCSRRPRRRGTNRAPP